MPRARVIAIRAAIPLSFLLIAFGVAPVAAASKAVHVRGTVYTFNDASPIAGATVRVAELPGVVASTGVDGSYDLEVPDGTTVTPYVTAAGHHGIYLQTFVTAGKDIRRANFQTPTDDVYSALAALLAVPLDENGDPRKCVVVSTFSTAAVRDLSFAEFAAYGAHGVAGATASATPALPDPIYFNSSVIPDRSLTESSDDGGVIWLGVPRGVYRFRADHPTARFAPFLATCEPGRLVNANPPQGLYQLRAGERVDTRVRAKIASVRARRSRRKRVVSIVTRADEYASVTAEVTGRGKRLGRAGNPERPGAYRKGRRETRVVVSHGGQVGRAKLTVRFADATGNEKVVTRKIRLPGI